MPILRTATSTAVRHDGREGRLRPAPHGRPPAGAARPRRPEERRPPPLDDPEATALIERDRPAREEGGVPQRSARPTSASPGTDGAASASRDAPARARRVVLPAHPDQAAHVRADRPAREVSRCSTAARADPRHRARRARARRRRSRRWSTGSTRTDDRHIVTIEDPIEYYHDHKKALVTQREVGSDVPTSPRRCAARCARTPT